MQAIRKRPEVAEVVIEQTFEWHEVETRTEFPFEMPDLAFYDALSADNASGAIRRSQPVDEDGEETTTVSRSTAFRYARENQHLAELISHYREMQRDPTIPRYTRREQQDIDNG